MILPNWFRCFIVTTFTVLVAIIAMALLGGCAGTPISTVTHEDLQAAATYATQNGFPARAAVWTAIDTQLTACEDAIKASGPTKPNLPPNGGVFLAFEVGAEAVGSFSGVPANVKINCAPLPLIGFPLLPVKP